MRDLNQLSIISWLIFTGCDQKHEEEMDHEAIYKDFVLRVSSRFSFLFHLILVEEQFQTMKLLNHTGHGSQESQCKIRENAEQKWS